MLAENQVDNPPMPQFPDQRRSTMNTWILTRTHWVLDREHPEKMAARMFAAIMIVIGFATAVKVLW